MAKDKSGVLDGISLSSEGLTAPQQSQRLTFSMRYGDEPNAVRDCMVVWRGWTGITAPEIAKRLRLLANMIEKPGESPLE